DGLNHLQVFSTPGKDFIYLCDEGNERQMRDSRIPGQDFCAPTIVRRLLCNTHKKDFSF
ncbi:hypothetical protein GOV10_02940, partial [Candidatus Woesearchaeota archaeon]|nr:hypothetical protein [Candidatus Woesearchaeota archaeon]